MADISPDIVIITRDDLLARLDKSFQRGVERGKFEAGDTHSARARNCVHWHNGRCETCGVQWQYFEVGGDFKCPHFASRTSPSPLPTGE